MIRSIHRPALLIFAVTGLIFAQQQPPSGGWRRAGDQPPGPTANPSPLPQGQDPEPVDRSDAYGQPVQQSNPSGPAMRNDRPAYGLPPELHIQPGTYVTVRVNEPLSSDRNRPGDPFTATLAQPLVVNGVVVAQRGQPIYGVVTAAERAKSSAPSRLGLRLTSLTLADGTQVPLQTQMIGRQGGTTPAGAQAGTVAGTTAIGAAIGAAAGWGRGAAIGAGVGAMGGIIGVILTRNHPTVIYPETALTFRLESPVVVSTERAPQAFRYAGPDEYQRPVYTTQVRPRPVPPACAGYGCVPPPAVVYAPAPYAYPYFWGPGISFGWGWGPGFYRGYYRRWR